MKKISTVIILLTSLLLAACGGEATPAEIDFNGPCEDEVIVEEEFADEKEDDEDEHTLGQATAELPPGFYDFSADAALVVENFETVHPIFIIDGMLPEYYEELRDEFLAAASVPMTRSEFVLAVQRYATALHDGHMSTGIFVDMGTGRWFSHGGGINTNLVMRDGRIFLADEPDVEVIKIAGAPIDDIIYQIERYFFFENQSNRNRLIPDLVRHEVMWRRAGGEIAGLGQLRFPFVELTVLENGEQTQRSATVYTNAPSTNWPQADYIIRYEIDDEYGIFFISLRSFVDGGHITEVVEAIEEAISAGIRHFIVDLRGNGGGDSTAAQGCCTPWALLCQALAWCAVQVTWPSNKGGILGLDFHSAQTG